MSYNEVVSEVSRRAGAGEDIEAITRFLRDTRLDLMDSILALKDAEVCSTNDAKAAVFHSPAWADEVGTYKGFHSSLLAELDRQGLADPG